MMLKMVLLRQPGGPIRLTKRPCGIDSVTGASAWKAPVGVLNVMLTSATHSFGAEHDMRPRLNRVAARIAQSAADYIAKAVPAAIAVCVWTRALIEVPRLPADGRELLHLHKLSAAVSRARSHPGHHFASTFAALRMGDERAITQCMTLAQFAGVRSSLAGSDPPTSARRGWTAAASPAWASAPAGL